MVKYIYRKFKSAFNTFKFPDSWFWARYSINPYSGCEHACIYCDARSDRYYLEQDFENEVIIKSNIAKQLDHRLTKARKLLPDVFGPGGVTDAYQPIERKVKNTRKILKVLLKHQFPVFISTKSSLILRDIDLLRKIAKSTWCTIAFTVTTLDQDLSAFLEPYSSTTRERLLCMKKLKEEAPEIQIGTNFMPIIPFLEDNDDNLKGIVHKSKQAGADFILFALGLTLRDSQLKFFIRKLKISKYQQYINPILELCSQDSSSEGSKEYFKKKNLKLLKLCKNYGLKVRAERWIPKDYRKWNYVIAELILNKEYIQSIKGKPNLQMRFAGLYLNNLEESIINVYRRGELMRLKNFNSSLIEFVEPFLQKINKTEEKRGLDRFL